MIVLPYQIAFVEDLPDTHPVGIINWCALPMLCVWDSRAVWDTHPVGIRNWYSSANLVHTVMSARVHIGLHVCAETAPHLAPLGYLRGPPGDSSADSSAWLIRRYHSLVSEAK